MKYVVLKNSLNSLSVELPEGFGEKLEIACFENQTEFEEYLKTNKVTSCPFGFLQSMMEPDGLFIKQNDYFHKIPFVDVAWVEASRSYSYIHLAGNSRIIVTYPLSEVKKKMPSRLFVQIHRSYLVNVNYVDKFIGNMLYINKQSLPISRKYKKDVLSRFLFLDNIKDTLDKEQYLSGDENEPLGNLSLSENSKDLILWP